MHIKNKLRTFVENKIEMKKYIKEQSEIRVRYAKKYRNCNSTLDAILIDIQYRAVNDRLWNEFVERSN